MKHKALSVGPSLWRVARYRVAAYYQTRDGRKRKAWIDALGSSGLAEAARENIRRDKVRKKVKHENPAS